MKNQELEYVHCNLCATSSATTELYDFDPFKIVRCDHCGLVYVNPRLTERAVLELYENSYFENPGFFSGNAKKLYGYSSYKETRLEVEPMYEKILGEIEGWKKGASLLEIGSAYGFFLNIARQRGWEVSGVELSPEAAKFSRAQFGIDPFIGSLGRYFSSASKKFDVVAFFDVFEHLHDPSRALMSIHSILNPGGIIAFAVPNSAPWTFRLLGSRWEDLQRAKSNEHLYFFHEKTLQKILDKCGFEMLGVKTMGRWFNLKHLCDRLTIYNKTFFSWLGRFLSFLGADQKSIYLNPGLKIIAYARKIER
jgi:SAM-dependent methyltransferase